jgi:signal transduction histidine kinase/DNA-binding response OmpR family regulator/ligand-binding sensor domain-containing protein
MADDTNNLGHTFLRIISKAACMKYPLTGLLLSCCLQLSAQQITANLSTDHAYSLIRHQWTERDGLPNWNVYRYLQDSNGLMWLVTYSGLFTFDGLQFRKANLPAQYFQNLYVAQLAEDHKGNVWIFKSSGQLITIDVFIVRQQQLIPLEKYLSLAQPLQIPTRSNDPFIFHNRGGKIWLGTNQIGYQYDGRLKLLFKNFPPTDEAPVWAPAPAGGRWLLADDHIGLVDSSGQQLHQFTHRSGQRVKSHWVDEQQRLWLHYVDPSTGQTVNYCQLTVGKDALQVRQQQQPPQSAWYNVESTKDLHPLLIAYGFKISRYADGWFLESAQSKQGFNLSLLHPDIEAISGLYIDQEGGIWGSNSNGLSRFVIERRLPFSNYLNDQHPPYSLRGLYVDNGYLIALGYNGAQKVNLRTKSFQPLQLPLNEETTCLLPYKGNILIGSYRRDIVCIDPRTSAVQWQLPLNGYPLNSLFMDSQNKLLGGTQNGLCVADVQSRKITPWALSPHQIFHLHENQQGLWAGTSNGLYKLSLQGKVLGHYFKAGNPYEIERIEHLWEDHKGIFWLATKGAGLILWNPVSGDVQQFDTRTGFSNNNIHAVYPDGLGNVWLPSDKGLMRLQISTKQIQTYFKRDGIADDEFNTFSHCRGPDGRLYFGGINGVTSFMPKDIPPSYHSDRKIHIIDTRIFTLKTGRYTTHFYNGYQPEKLSLRPEDAYLDISISPLVYEQNARLDYAWKIEGLHADWVVQSSPTIRLNNLPYGNNTLLIRYRQRGSNWQDKPFRLEIRVERPYYLRLPFLLFITGLLVGLFYLFSYLRNRQLRANNLQLEREVIKRTQQIEENLAIIEGDRQTISRQAKELRALDEMKSRFFANVTHELRTPLTLILGPTDRLLHNRTDESTAKEYLRNIQRNALRLLNLVEELLDLSKMESSTPQLDESPAALKPFLERMVANFEPYAKHRRIRLSLNYQCDEDLLLMLDLRKWEKIINNLLGNAFKYTSEGGNILLSIKAVDKKLLLQVIDDGQGIHPDDLPNIFDRYYQSSVNNPSLQGGTGIGLSLCKEYARQFGGEIRVESTLGEGSTFSLLFPVKVAHPLTAVSATEPFTPASPQIPVTLFAEEVKPHKILIVEDDLDMLNYLQSILADEFTLFTADHGQRALELLASQPVDLILSDLMMPTMDGLQLLEVVKERFYDLPFILLTARVEAEDRMKALRLGVDDYLTKPFIEEELTTRIHNLLSRYEIRRTMRAEISQQDNSSNTDTPLSYDQKWLLEVEQIVSIHLSDVNFSVQALADKLNITKRTLQTKLKLYTGMTPNQYLTELRLIRAHKLLADRTFETITEVCYAVGFKTPWYLSRLMKERFGKHPSDF